MHLFVFVSRSCVWPPTVTPSAPRQQVVYFSKGRPRLQTPPYWPQVMVAIPHPLFRTPHLIKTTTHTTHTHILQQLSHTHSNTTSHATPQHSAAAHSTAHHISAAQQLALPFHRRYVFPSPLSSPPALLSSQPRFDPPCGRTTQQRSACSARPPAPRSTPSLCGGCGAVAGRSAPPPPHLAACPGPFPLLVCFG